jgi:hypothetical protein
MATLASKWDINGNGFPGTLKINVDGNGNLINSTVYDVEILGFWDQTSQKLTFIRLIDKNNPSTFQIFTGYLHSDGKAISGTFEAFQGTGGTAKQSVCGWFATPTPTPKPIG